MIAKQIESVLEFNFQLLKAVNIREGATIFSAFLTNNELASIVAVLRVHGRLSMIYELILNPSGPCDRNGKIDRFRSNPTVKYFNATAVQN